MKRLIISTFFIGLILLFAGCATILGAKYQKVTVVTTTDGSVVKLGDKEYEGDSLEIKVKKEATFITNHRQGFLDETVVICPYKRSPMIVTNLIAPIIVGAILASGTEVEGGGTPIMVAAFGLGLIFMYYDQGAGAYRFPPEDIRFDELEKVPVRQEDQKFLFVDKTEFDWQSGDIEFKYYNSGKTYFKGKSGSISEFNSTNVTGESFELSNELNEVLAEYDLTDTTESFFGNNYKSLLIDCKITGANIEYVEDAFVRVEFKIEWKIKDAFKKEIYSKTIRTKSNPYPTSIEAKDVMSNALRRNLLKLIIDPEVEEILTTSSLDDRETMDVWEEIEIEMAPNASGVSSAVKSVVTIKVDGGHGSGCIISNDGYIVTNFHVVSANDSVEVIFNDGSKSMAQVVRTNPRVDLALIKVDKVCENILQINKEDDAELGIDIFAVGTPANIKLGQTVSKGIISGQRKFEDIDYIQTDVSINGGNSGGALLDKEGVLLGIVNAKMVGIGVEGIGFAIPAKYVFSELKIKIK